jgi:hypothetical protein
MERNVEPPETRQSLHDHSTIVTPIKSKAPDFSEARPYQRAGVHPACAASSFVVTTKPPLSNYWQ